MIARNDNWQTDEEAIEATGVPPKHPKESGILLLALSAGGYTAIVRGKSRTRGVGLA